IGGGAPQDGTASRAVLVYRAGARRATTLAELRVPTTHASAAALGGAVYVIGGRGAASTALSRAIVAIDPVTGHIRPAGSLRAPRSDLAAVSLGKTILIAGGRSNAGTVAQLSELVPTRAHVHAKAV